MTKVYALYGRSGTGKSHRAVTLAYSYKIPVIIDDGLIIHQGTKVPGSKSGKEEKYKLGAIKRAIFNDPDYAREMRRKLWKLAPEKILIVGTSKSMIGRILSNLELPEPEEWISINKLTSLEERQMAKQERNRGRHVVPLSPVEVLASFRVPLLERLKLFSKEKGKKKKYLGEQSVVKAKYHFLGRIYLTPQAVRDLTEKFLEHQSAVSSIKKINIKFDDTHKEIHAQLVMYYGCNLKEVGTDIHQKLSSFMCQMSGIEDIRVKIDITGVDFQESS